MLAEFLHCSPAGSHWVDCLLLDRDGDGYAILYFDVWLNDYHLAWAAADRIRFA